MDTLRLATRGSDLATTQSGWVADRVQEATGFASQLEIVKTIGDQRTDVRLADVGSIGLFTKEVQDAVLEGRADYAVHSLKDLPASQTPGLVLAAVPVREETRDWLVIRPDAVDADREGPLPLKNGAIVGTSAARRLAFLRHFVPDCEDRLLRGNVPTRLQKLADGEYDAILLAGAGLRRLDLDLTAFHVEKLDPWVWPGAPGQGALALECREDDVRTRDLLAKIHNPAGAESVEVERSLLRALGGGCGLPLGATASREDAELRLVAALGPTDPEGNLPEPTPGVAMSLTCVEMRGPEIDGLVEAAFQALCRPEEV
ncbi:MAG: hydroxymethylbilane synthase [Planctomycetota bacterium]